MKPVGSIGIAAFFAASALGAPVRVGPVAAELIAEVEAISPGEPFTVALRLALDAPWHAYWINPGDSGLAPALAWTLPPGFVAGDLQFPPPVAIATPPFMTYGLEGEVLFLATITPPADAPKDGVILKAEADWLICKEICVAGQAELELALPVRAGPAPLHPVHAARIAAARDRLPAEASRWTFRAQQMSNRYWLFATPPEDAARDIPVATFFPFDAGQIRHAAPQAWRRKGNDYVLELVPADPLAPPPEKLAGVLVATLPWFPDRPQRALRMEAPFSEDSPRFTHTERNKP